MQSQPKSMSNTFQCDKSTNQKDTDNKKVDEQTNSIPELLRNLPYTSGKRLLLCLLFFLPSFLRIPILLKYRKLLKLHHPLDSENELWNLPYHLIERDKSSNQNVYYRRAIEWRPEDFFRPAYFAGGLLVGLDGTTRAAKTYGKWSRVSWPNDQGERRREPAVPQNSKPAISKSGSPSAPPPLLDDKLQSIKELGACWPRLARTALEASLSLQKLILLVSQEFENQQNTESSNDQAETRRTKDSEKSPDAQPALSPAPLLDGICGNPSGCCSSHEIVYGRPPHLTYEMIINLNPHDTMSENETSKNLTS